MYVSDNLESDREWPAYQAVVAIVKVVNMVVMIEKPCSSINNGNLSMQQRVGSKLE